MTEHLPECPLIKPCCDDTEFPEHGFCLNDFSRCLHCMSTCICDALRACEERGLSAGYTTGYGAAMEDGWGEPGHIAEAVSAAMEAAAKQVQALVTGQDFHATVTRSFVTDVLTILKGEGNG